MCGEIEFYRKCLEKMGIQSFSGKEDGELSSFDYGIRKSCGEGITLQAFLNIYSGEGGKKPRLIHIFDRFVLSYLILELDGDRLVIGPYVVSMPTERIISSIAEGLSLTPEERDMLLNTYFRIPEIQDEMALIQSSTVIMDMMWEDGWEKKEITATLSDLKSFEKQEKRDLERVEKTYWMENLLIDAVRRGDAAYIQDFPMKLKNLKFALRVPDPVRNLKNYLIIMNTLLRKAAEQGGVPIRDIDKLSGRFAHAIEECRTVENLLKVGASMPYSYVMLVRSNMSASYSTIVVRALSIMEENRTATLPEVAERLNVTPGWLSRCISRDTGMSFTHIMMKLRADYAGVKLLTTDESIEEIAEEAGFSDMSYFSRVFRKVKGKTPTEWRVEGIC